MPLQEGPYTMSNPLPIYLMRLTLPHIIRTILAASWLLVPWLCYHDFLALVKFAGGTQWVTHLFGTAPLWLAAIGLASLGAAATALMSRTRVVICAALIPVALSIARLGLSGFFFVVNNPQLHTPHNLWHLLHLQILSCGLFLVTLILVQLGGLAQRSQQAQHGHR